MRIPDRDKKEADKRSGLFFYSNAAPFSLKAARGAKDEPAPRGYIIPPMSGGIPAPACPPAGFSSGISATMTSVVRSRLATEAAF